ncbi:MAG: tetratricopeptide repeat protein [bacterium]
MRPFAHGWWRWRARRALALARRATAEPGLGPRARSLLEAAIASGESTGCNDAPAFAACVEELAVLTIRAGDLAASEGLIARRVALGEAQGDRAAQLALADFLYRVTLRLRAARQHALAEPHARRALALLESAVPPADPRIEQALDTLASIALRTGKLADAEQLLVRLLAIEERHGGGLALASTLNRLAQVARSLGKHAEASVIDERVAALRDASRG